MISTDAGGGGTGRRTLGWLCLVVFLAVVTSGGCGKKEKPAPPRPPAPRPQQPQPQPKPKAGPEAEVPPGKQMMEGELQPPGTMPGEPPAKPVEEEKPSRPDDVSEWKKDDYFWAKEEGDPKLADAIAYLGEHFAGKPAAARMLANLLEYKEPEPEPEHEAKPKGQGEMGMEPGARHMPGRPMQPGRHVHSHVNLIGPLVAALTANGTDAAREVLKQLVEGTFKTEDDYKATEMALEALADHPSADNEAILFRALTESEKLRKPAEKEAMTRRPGQPGHMRQPEHMRKPGHMRQPGQSGGRKMTAEELRDKTLKLIEPLASEQFRIDLAKHLLDPKTPDEQYEQFLEVVDKRCPDNVAAQMILYLSSKVDKQTEATIEQYFAEYSSEALAGILGLPPEVGLSTTRRPSRVRHQPSRFMGESSMPRHRGQMPGRRPGSTRRPGTIDPEAQPPDPDLPYRLARHLWNPKFTQIVRQRLDQVETLEQGTDTIVLAGTMPSDAMRSGLHKVLKKYWKDGPGVVESAGVPKGLVSDPGFLFVLKTLPRQEYDDQKVKPRSTRPKQKRPSSRSSSHRSKSTTRSTSVGRTKQIEAAEKFKQTGQDWMGFSESFARTLCDRFHGKTAADSRTGQKGRGQPSAKPRRRRRPVKDEPGEDQKSTAADVKPDTSLPIKLPADANVVTARHIKWPDDVAKKLDGVTVDPMEIHYVRIEENARLIKVRGYYSRQLKSPTAHRVPSGLWLDSFGVSSKPGKKLSIDVLVTPVEEKSNVRGQDNEEPEGAEDLIIEILTIEMNEIK